MSECKDYTGTQSSSIKKSKKFSTQQCALCRGEIVRYTISKCQGNEPNSSNLVKEQVTRPRVNQISPKQEQAEKKNYLQFMVRSVFKNNQSWREMNLLHLYTIIKISHQRNGLISILSEGNWQNVVRKIKEQDNFFINKTSQQILNIFLENILEFEFFIANSTLCFTEGIEHKIDIKEALFLPGDYHLKSKQSEYFNIIINNDVVVFRGGLKALESKQQLITFEKILEQYGEAYLDTFFKSKISQKFQAEQTQKKVIMKLKVSQYIEYLINSKRSPRNTEKFKNEQCSRLLHSEKFIPQNSKFYIKFCQLLEKSFLSPNFRTNILSYLSQPYSNLKSPAISFNCENSWQGGQLEKFGFSLLTINHGPDPIQWFVISKNNFFYFRNAVQKDLNIDINERQEGFFLDAKWLIEKGCSFKRILQKQSDIIFIGPGTYYWKRSLGYNLVSTWKNLLPSYQSLKETIACIQNDKSQIKKHTILPIKSLLFQYFIHCHGKIQDKSIQVLSSFFSRQLESENINLDLLIKKQKIPPLLKSTYQKDRQLSYICRVCSNEILNYYISNHEEKSVLCVKCLQNSYSHDKLMFSAAFKFDHYSLSLVLKDIKSCSKQWLCNRFCFKKTECAFEDCRKSMKSNKRIRKEDGISEKNQQQSIYIKKIKQFIRLNDALSQNQQKPKFSHLLKLYNDQNNKVEEDIQTIKQSSFIKCPNCKFTIISQQLPSKKKKQNETPQCFIVNDFSSQSLSTQSNYHSNTINKSSSSKCFIKNDHSYRQNNLIFQKQSCKREVSLSNIYQRESQKSDETQRYLKFSSNYQRERQISSNIQRNYRGQNNYKKKSQTVDNLYDGSNCSSNHSKRRQNAQYSRRNHYNHHETNGREKFYYENRKYRKPTSDLQTVERRLSQARINYEPSY